MAEVTDKKEVNVGEDELKELSPTEYFEKVKEMKHETSEEDIQYVLENCLILLEKPKITGQSKMAKKIFNQSKILIRELEAVKAGFSTYVLKEDILYYIENIAKKTVKIIEMEKYEREIPDNVVDKIIEAKKYFDDFYIVFTDYTGEQERQVEKEKRDKDPILFGTIDRPDMVGVPTNRLYFIADWVDKYCDLTLEELVMQYESERGEGMTYVPTIPKTIDELKEAFRLFDEKDPTKTELYKNSSNNTDTTLSEDTPDDTPKKRRGRPRKK